MLCCVCGRAVSLEAGKGVRERTQVAQVRGCEFPNCVPAVGPERHDCRCFEVPLWDVDKRGKEIWVDFWF